uniref:Transmembrane protein 53 n=1 Tax=Haemonchus contortus TaxID=6289 RepID=A0A7I4XTY1_HAECO
MLARNCNTFLGGFHQIRSFFSRHVYEPRLIVRNPLGSDKKPLPVDPFKPVVLLIGWAGAEHEHLAKYSDIYTEQGYRTVSFIAPCYHYTTPNARNGFYLSPVFRGIDAKPGNFESFKHSPLICHVFSMNGVRTLISLWKWTEAERMTHLRQRIKGLIFDSAPARTTAGPDSHAVVVSTPPMEGFRWVSTDTRRKMIMVAFNIRKALANSVSAVWPAIRPHLSMYYYLRECSDLPNSLLFLYSREDKLIRYKYVKRFLDHQKSLGRDVVEVVFTNSEHVQHLRTHPEQYRSSCIEFVKKIEKSLEQ